MGCRLRIFLTATEKRTLKQLRKAANVPRRTQDRAQVLLLNARGCKNNQIAGYLDWSERTVRQTIHRWQEQGLAGLWDAPRTGRQRLWQEADLVYLEESLQQEPRTYNSKQLAEKLRRERQVQLSPDRIRRVLKKRGGFGSEQGPATGTSSIQLTKPLSKDTLMKIADYLEMPIDTVTEAFVARIVKPKNF